MLGDLLRPSEILAIRQPLPQDPLDDLTRLLPRHPRPAVPGGPKAHRRYELVGGRPALGTARLAGALAELDVEPVATARLQRGAQLLEATESQEVLVSKRDRRS